MAKDHKPERVAPYERLHDLQSWEILFIVCRCGRFVEVNRKQLMRVHSGAVVMRELEPRLKCKGCGERGKAGFAVKKMQR